MYTWIMHAVSPNLFEETESDDEEGNSPLQCNGSQGEKLS